LYGKLQLASGINGYSYYKLEQLGESIGCSSRQISNYLKQLKELELIEVKRRGSGLNNEYYFLWNEELLSSSVNRKNIDLLIKHEEQVPNEMKDTSNTLYKNNIKESTKRNNVPVGTNVFLGFDVKTKNNILSVVNKYKKLINPKVSVNSDATFAIERRLQEFTIEELLLAVENFSKNEWFMRHHRFHPIPWLFSDEDKVSNWTHEPSTVENLEPLYSMNQK